MSHDFTVVKLRERIEEEATLHGVFSLDLPVEVWTQSTGREFKILDVVFDDGVISLEVEEVY